MFLDGGFCVFWRFGPTRLSSGGREREVLPGDKEVRLISIPVTDCAGLSPPALGVGVWGVGGGRIMESTEGSAAAPAKHSDSSVGESEMVAMQMETEGHPPENGFVSPETTTPGLLTQIDQCVLPFLGGFGRYQKQLILLTWIPALLIGAIQFSDNFLLDQPNSTCVQPVLNASASTAAPSALSARPTNNGTRGDQIYNNGANGPDGDADDTHCPCSEWKFKLHTGLVQNVVTKVSGPSRGWAAPIPACVCVIPSPPPALFKYITLKPHQRAPVT